MSRLMLYPEHQNSGKICRTAFVILLFLCHIASANAEAVAPENPDHAWQAPLASKSLLLSADSAGDTVYSVGERGHILRRTTGQSIWQQSPVPTQALLTSITMIDNQQGWVVGHDAIILHTSNGGKSWEKQFEAPDEQRPLMDVFFTDQKNGFALGAYGYFLFTQDGGKHWQSRMINEEHDFHLNAMADAKQLYIAAEAGYVYRSKDRGVTWETLNPPYEGSFFDIATLKDKQLVVVGLRGHAFLSNDEGDHWQPMETGTQASLNKVMRLTNGQVLVAGHTGMLLLSNEDLTRFSPYQFPDRKAISDMVELNNNRLLMVGEFGARTVNLCNLFTSDQLSACSKNSDQ